MQEYVMGNGAIALGALAAGVNLVAGYPVHRPPKYLKPFRNTGTMAYISNGP